MNDDVTMIRTHLERIPDYPLPAGMTLRPVTPDDPPHWTRIQRRADLYNEIGDTRFREEFTDDPVLHGGRILLLCPANGGDPIGTAAAWYGSPPYDRRWGRVHWLAIDPDWQGKGLSKPLMAATLRRLVELGHEKAYLTTVFQRTVAVYLYRKFGFETFSEEPML